MKKCKQLKKEYLGNEYSKCNHCGKKFKLGNITGYYVPSCDCQEEIDLRREGQSQAEFLRDRVESIKEHTGIEKRFQNKTFDNYDKSQNAKAYEETLNYVKNLKENLSKGEGLLLCGNVGSGKTHLIAAMIDYIARIDMEWIEAGDIVFINTIDLLFKLQCSYDDHTTKNIVGLYENCKLLFLDDLGVGKITDWTVGTLYKIINKRYEKKLSTIIATNMSLGELKKNLDERLFSRIIEVSRGIELKGKDHRLQKILSGWDTSANSPKTA